MLVVHTNQITNRLKYVLDFVFLSRGIEYDLSDETGSNSHLVYGLELEDSPFEVSNLLFNTDLEPLNVELTSFGEAPCLKINGKSDPLASVFYILTRYEEYQSTTLDEHGRYPYAESIFYKNDLVEKAICDRLASEIIRSLDLKESIAPKPQIIPTFDIDNTFAYRLKYGMREFASRSKDFITGNKTRIAERKLVKNGERDPYDTFDIIEKAVSGNEGSRIFWLVGDWAKKDRNVSMDNPEHKKLLTRMSKSAQIGIHPSYKSFQQVDIIKKEMNRIADVLGTEIVDSRQHFLRFNLPLSYQCLLDVGIINDYSMGFAERAGFRCGTARSHHWFDLSTNEKTNLVVHPFVYMDGTLNEYMDLSIDESKKIISSLYDEVCTYGGNFIFIWHNETIGDYGKWEGWKEVLTYTLNLND